MDRYRIVFGQNAKDDIIGIINYITYTLRAVDASNNLIKGLYKSISHLSYFPYKFPIVKNSSFTNMVVRCMPYKNYLFFYEIIENEKTIGILRIVYKQRNWKNLI